MSTAALLTYALPLRQLHITGREHAPDRWLDSSQVSAAVAADTYSPTGRSESELIADLGSWSLKIQHAAGGELATRALDSSQWTQITALANDPAGSARAGACIALGKHQDPATAEARAATLAALLDDPNAHIRLIASGMPALAAMENPDNSQGFNAVFARRKDYTTAQLDYQVQFSADLQSWWASPESPMLWDASGADDVDLMYLPFPESIDTPSGTQAPSFFRVRIEMIE